MNLGTDVKVTRVINATAVGTTDIDGTILDMEGYEGVLFIGEFGTITDGTPALKAQQGQVSNMSDAADLAGTSVALATTDDNKCAVLDLFRPAERYVRCVIVRGGATGAVFDGALAIQYGATKRPTTNDTTVAATETHVSPAEGTA